MPQRSQPEMILPAKVDVRVLAAVSRFAGTDESRPYLMGVHVEVGCRDVVYIGTDGRRLIALRLEKLREEDDNDLTGAFTIPTVHCRAFKLKKDSDPFADLYESGDRLTLRKGDVELRFTPLDGGDFVGRWPDWRHCIPRGPFGRAVGQYDCGQLASFQKFADEMPGGFPPFIAHNGRDGGALIRFHHIDAIGVVMPVKMDDAATKALPAWIHTQDLYRRADERRETAHTGDDGHQDWLGDWPKTKREAIQEEAESLGDHAQNIVDGLRPGASAAQPDTGDDAASGETGEATADGSADAAAPVGDDLAVRHQTAALADGDAEPPAEGAIASTEGADAVGATTEAPGEALDGSGFTAAELAAMTPEQRANVDRLAGIKTLHAGDADPIATADEDVAAAQEAAEPSDGPKKRRGRRTTEQRLAAIDRDLAAGSEAR